MTSLQMDFSQFNDQQKIDFINKNAPYINKFLNQNISNFKKEELTEVAQLAQIEQSSKKILEDLNKNLQDFITNYGTGIEANSATIQPEQITKVNDIYQRTIIRAILDIIELNKKNEHSTSMNVDDLTYNELYSKRMLSQTSSILENILFFKYQLDQEFPDLAEQIIAIATPALVCLVGAYSPGLAVAISFAPILISVARTLINNIDFKSIFDTINEIIDKIRGNEQLNEISKIGEKVGEIAQSLEKPVSSISKFNFSLEGAKEIIKGIKENPDIKEFITKIAEFAEKHIPASKVELVTNIQSIVSNTLNKLEKAGVTGDNFNKIKETITKHASAAKEIATEVFTQGNQIFNKVSGVIQIAQELSKPEKTLSTLLKINGVNKESLEIIAKHMSAPSKDMGVHADNISKSLALKNPVIKAEAAKLGSNNVAELMLKNVAAEKGVSKEMSREK